jgi:hypothetical protein
VDTNLPLTFNLQPSNLEPNLSNQSKSTNGADFNYLRRLSGINKNHEYSNEKDLAI